MVKKKTTVTTYKKKYYWRRKKAFNNYFKAMGQMTLEAVYKKPEGQNLEFGMYNANLAPATQFLLSTLIQQCPTWPAYKNLFSQFVLRGFSIKATPSGNNSNVAYSGMIKIGLVDQSAGYDWRLVEDANYGIILSPITVSRTYINMINKGIGYVKMNSPNELPGALQMARSNENMLTSIGLYWSLEIKWYITFKQNIA